MIRRTNRRRGDRIMRRRSMRRRGIAGAWEK